MNTQNKQELKCPLANGANEQQQSHSGQSRRGFIGYCIGAMAAVSALFVAFPIFAFFRLPRKIGGGGIERLVFSGLHPRSSDDPVAVDGDRVTKVIRRRGTGD